jgi:hypothetical protein
LKQVARKNVYQGPVRRGQLLAERARARPLRELFPQLEKLDVELRFTDRNTFSHSPQCHTLHPGALAFFRFTCPCVGCDGDFDLAAIVREAVTAAESQRKPMALEGRLECTGNLVRFPGGPGPCQLGLRYRIIGTLQKPVRATA